MKTLSQIIGRVPQAHAEQRNHLVHQYIRMRRSGLNMATARQITQFGADTVLGWYRKVDYADLLRETITLVDILPDGTRKLLAVCRPPQGRTRRASLEIIGSDKKQMFPTVWAAHRHLSNTLYRQQPNSYFDDANGLQYV